MFAVPLHVTGADACVTKRGGRLVVVRGGRPEHSTPLLRVSMLVLHGAVGVTTPALHALLDAGVGVVLLARNGRALGRLETPGCSGAAIRRQQLETSADERRCVELGAAIVGGKIRNQRALLLRRGRRRAGLVPDEALARLAALAHRAEQAKSRGEVVGLEGAAAAVFFKVLRSSILPAEVVFARRDRAGPDVVNAGINYCSALLRETLVSALWARGLDPGLSCLHRPVTGRPTLAFDLMEEWRAVLIEGTVVPLVCLGALGAADVECKEEGPRLSDRARRAVISRFYDRLASPVSTWPPLGHRSSYQMAIGNQVATYAAWVAGRSEYRPFRWR